MNSYKERFEKLIKNIWYIIPVILTSLMSFGFVLTHSSVNIDTLAYDRYFEGGELIAQGRFAAPLINKIFGIMNFNPFFVDFIAVIFLILAATIFCMLFMRISNGKLKDIVYTIFSCLFISYPLINEIFVYTPASLSIGLGYCLIGTALIFSYEFINAKKPSKIILIAILLCFATSLYESFAAVYLCGIVMILILNYLFSDNSDGKKFWINIKNALWMMIPLVAGVIVNMLIGKILLSIFDIEKSEIAQKTITYGTLGLIGGIKNLIKTVASRYILPILYYVPITTLAIGIGIVVILMIMYAVKKKGYLIQLLFIALVVACFSLAIIQGMAAPYRTCQTFALFIAFVFMIFIQEIKLSKLSGSIKKLIIVLTFVMIFYQAKNLHRWFYVNYLRYEEEKNVVIAIGNKLKAECDTSKPIIFTNNYFISSSTYSKACLSSKSTSAKIIKKFTDKLNIDKYDFSAPWILKITENNIESYIAWATLAFPLDTDSNFELIKFFNYLGYDFSCGTKEMYKDACKMVEGKEHWPKTGSIIETDNYVIVNF